MIIRDRLHDEKFIAARAEQFEQFAETVRNYPPERVEAITGVSARDIEAAARLYGQAEKAMILYGLGVTEHTSGSLGVMCCAESGFADGQRWSPGCRCESPARTEQRPGAHATWEHFRTCCPVTSPSTIRRRVPSSRGPGIARCRSTRA